MLRDALRNYLAVNMFDGDGDYGTVTMQVRVLLDEVVDNVAHFLLDTYDDEES